MPLERTEPTPGELTGGGSAIDLVHLRMTRHQVYRIGFAVPGFRYSSGTRLPT